MTGKSSRTTIRGAIVSRNRYAGSAYTVVGCESHNDVAR